MGRAVTRLEEIYGKCRDRALGRRRTRRRDRTSTTSGSIVLGIALLRSQKETLVLTGTLRLLNTIVQSFPALIVARLLRQIEAGRSVRAVKPLTSAFALVSVLSVKMLIENQYFHNVVKCACEVRGSISGMIFDKGMRLSGGGGGAVRKTASGGSGYGKGSSVEDGTEGEGRKRSTAAPDLGSGGVLNLMQSDVTIIEMLTLQLHTLWDGILQTSIYIALLYKFLGPPVIWGVMVLLTTIPINAVTLRILNRLSRKETEAKDARMRKTTESIVNMLLLKLQSWENIFADGIQSHREEELMRLRKRGSVRALNQAISNAVPTITLVVTLSAYAKTGKPIVASTIFTAISLFNQLRFPLLFYPMLIDSMANGKNSLRRISQYLTQEEIAPYVERREKIDGEGGSIEMINGNFLWAWEGESGVDRHVPVPALRNASIYVGPGEIVAVVGDVGSGKSALVKSLIGELSPVPRMVFNQTLQNDGGSHDSVNMPRVTVQGSIAYCAQEAWLPKGTIRESVVFGREYNEERYLNAVYVAGLDGDLAKGLLTHDTDVGEDGSNLSGGQRARVALARAFFEESAGVYILDDPLSALDATVASTVFERVSARLRREKAATVFVTNDPNLPRRCDKVILMGSSGSSSCSQIIDVGTYDELISRGHDLNTIVHHEEEDKDSDEDYECFSSAIALNGDPSVQFPSSNYNATVSNCHADPDCKNTLQQDPVLLAEHVVPQPIEPSQDSFSLTADRRQLSTDDSMSTGAVRLTTYTSYFKSVKSPLLIAGAIASYLISNGSQFFQQLIIARWTDAGKGGAMASSVSAKYLNQLVYAAVMVSVSMYYRSYLTMRVGVRASNDIHRKMLKSVFKAPLSFFSSTPSGQLLTRFGKELDVVDRSLPDGIASVLYCSFQIFFSIVALAGAVSPLLAIPILTVGMFYVKAMGRFRPAARDLKRCESKSRSPIYTHFREALRGAETIRSIPSGRSVWSQQHRSLTDKNISVFYSVKALDRWLSVRLESLGNAVVLTAAVGAVFLTRAGNLKSGAAGWGLTQALSITGLLTVMQLFRLFVALFISAKTQWAVRTLTDAETQFLSVERLSELTNLESKATNGLETEDIKPLMSGEYSGVGEESRSIELNNSIVPLTPESEAALLKSGWPIGHVQFKDVSMRYTPDSPLVLRSLSVDIPAGTTLGVVGRTGSGKSSLLLTLFRLVDVEGAGSITIDGVDIRSLSLEGLRESLSIIPQTPTLFAGTLLYNLDSTGRATAEEAWRALEAASTELARQFRDSDFGLETMISEGGGNLSQGQKQLICLARALLKHRNILVLDEATSSVDTKTDSQVQDTIYREFVQKGVTVITVAHRLDTVLGYDKILVLDAGKMVEFGTPDELLSKNGYLRNLYDADQRNRQKGSKRKLADVSVI
ncbi:hypothetical protein ACHAW5_005871 [Stephanodiscus triporus]|uniref:Uncharacterized protein n=1 Tax=Stephanodiscus triporus TaxID=2934178 RepID=A0ABD3QV12_9STRA